MREIKCDHCYCRIVDTIDEDWKKKIPHKKCCNCGNMQALSEAELNIKTI